MLLLFVYLLKCIKNYVNIQLELLNNEVVMAKISCDSMMQMLRIQRYREIANYDKVIDLGIDTMWKGLCEKVKSSDIDPTDIFDDEMEMLRNLKYSMKLMNICCLSETWEQDLYNFLKDKGLIRVFSNDYRETKRVFEQAYPSCAISKYHKIEEMRALVNAIKHGEGKSFANIRRLTSDSILADSNLGVIDKKGVATRKKQIEFDGNTLTSRTLNVEGKLQIYSDAIVKFWEDVFAIENANVDTSESSCEIE